MRTCAPVPDYIVGLEVGPGRGIAAKHTGEHPGVIFLSLTTTFGSHGNRFQLWR